MLRKKFVTVGNSWSIIIPKALLKCLGINPITDEVGITVEDNAIKIVKVKDEKKD